MPLVPLMTGMPAPKFAPHVRSPAATTWMFPPEVIFPVLLNVVNAPVLGVVAPTVPLCAPFVLIDAVPVRFVTVPELGVPNAPLNSTGAPALPVLIAKAVAMPVPRPETPVLMGKPVQLVSVPL